MAGERRTDGLPKKAASTPTVDPQVATTVELEIKAYELTGESGAKTSKPSLASLDHSFAIAEALFNMFG
jgi:hypothetical protein